MHLVCPLLAHPHPLPGHSRLWPLLTFLCPSLSKQRHNKLWRQQTKSCLQQPVDDPAGPGDFLPETLDDTPEGQLPCLDDAAQPGFPGSRSSGGPALPCCFRRLSDPVLHSLNDKTGSMVPLEDLERDALLGEAAQPAEGHKPARHAQEGSGLCEKEMKKKLEFGSPEARCGSLPQVEEMEREEGPGGGRWGQPPAQLDKTLLNCENLNNNNSKRSCPDDFEVSPGRWAGAAGRRLPSCPAEQLPHTPGTPFRQLGSPHPQQPGAYLRAILQANGGCRHTEDQGSVGDMTNPCTPSSPMHPVHVSGTASNSISTWRRR